MAIAAFEQSPAPGVWQTLDKKTILAEMRDRIQNPLKINQGQQPFCGPTSVLFELVRKQPVRYVRFCRSLFELGYLKTQSKQIWASDRLRRASRGELRMGQVDWMVLATLRDAESLIFPVEPNAPEFIRNLSGMSYSWEVKGWIKELLGFNQIIYNRTLEQGGLRSIRDAINSTILGGVAFPLVNAQGLLGTTASTEWKLTAMNLPNHWVALLGNSSLQNGRVAFDVYTWGRMMRVDVTEAKFKENFWGVVIGLP